MSFLICRNNFAEITASHSEAKIWKGLNNFTQESLCVMNWWISGVALICILIQRKFSPNSRGIRRNSGSRPGALKLQIGILVCVAIVRSIACRRSKRDCRLHRKGASNFLKRSEPFLFIIFLFKAILSKFMYAALMESYSAIHEGHIAHHIAWIFSS